VILQYLLNKNLQIIYNTTKVVLYMNGDHKKNNNNEQKKGEDSMAVITNRNIYDFNVKKDQFDEIIAKLNEHRIKPDFIKECLRISSQYKKPEKK